MTEVLEGVVAALRRTVNRCTLPAWPPAALVACPMAAVSGGMQGRSQSRGMGHMHGLPLG